MIMLLVRLLVSIDGPEWYFSVPCMGGVRSVPEFRDMGNELKHA